MELERAEGPLAHNPQISFHSFVAKKASSPSLLQLHSFFLTALERADKRKSELRSLPRFAWGPALFALFFSAPSILQLFTSFIIDCWTAAQGRRSKQRSQIISFSFIGFIWFFGLLSLFGGANGAAAPLTHQKEKPKTKSNK